MFYPFFMDRRRATAALVYVIVMACSFVGLVLAAISLARPATAQPVFTLSCPTSNANTSPEPGVIPRIIQYFVSLPSASPADPPEDAIVAKLRAFLRDHNVNLTRELNATLADFNTQLRQFNYPAWQQEVVGAMQKAVAAYDSLSQSWWGGLLNRTLDRFFGQWGIVPSALPGLINETLYNLTSKPLLHPHPLSFYEVSQNLLPPSLRELVAEATTTTTGSPRVEDELDGPPPFRPNSSETRPPPTPTLVMPNASFAV